MIARVARPQPSLLSELPRRERRALVRVAGVMEVPAGRRLLRQGALFADAFYMIERGRATVSRAGRQIAELSRGDVFGEIALLRGGPRTASVVAATDMRLRVVPELEFARAMRMLPTLARVVGRVSRERQRGWPSPAAATGSHESALRRCGAPPYS
jgi:CRP-like cAMP-binding protein